jgi:transposase
MVTAGQAGDITQAPALLEGQAGNDVLADKAYDGNALRVLVDDMGAKAVIPSNTTRKVALQPPQALPPFRHPLRQTHRSLHWLRSHRRRHDLATMNVDPT